MKITYSVHKLVLTNVQVDFTKFLLSERKFPSFPHSVKVATSLKKIRPTNLSIMRVFSDYFLGFMQKSQCGNYRKLLSHKFVKNFVKATC